MPSLTVNICVFTLVLLSTQQLCNARPNRAKREITKDYFHPLSPDHFEKSADGKYHLKKSAHRLDSEVKYVGDETNSVSPNELKSPSIEITKDKVDIPKIEKEPLKAVETEKVDLEVATPKPFPPILEEIKEVKEHLSPKSDIVVDDVKKTEAHKEMAPFTPVDPKFVIPPKPDSKDEIEVKTSLPPASSEEEKIDEKIAIGQIPHLYPRLIPIPNNFRVPILIPIHKISFGSVSVVPLPPAAVSDRLPLPPIDDVSDRLPMPLEDDIVGEGEHESASVEDVELAAERKKEPEGYPVNPLPVPLLSFGGFLKDLKDASLKDGEKETKVVDVLGKKFLMQSNVMKYPNSEGHTYVRFLSVKPLEKAETTGLKEGDADKSIEDKTLDVKDKEATDEFSAKKDEVFKSEDSFKRAEEAEVKKETAKEPEILKAEETQIQYKIYPQVPKKIAIKEEVGVQLQTEGKDLVEGLTEGTGDVLNDEKMVEVKHSLVEEAIKTEEGEKAMSSEEVGLEMKLGGEDGEMVYRAKLEEAEDKKRLKGDEGILSEEDTTALISFADSAVEKTVGGDVIESIKKEFFLPEKKKKDLIKSEEKSKSKKSIKEKKSKKKCSCEEEEYSDSDYSAESDDDY